MLASIRHGGDIYRNCVQLDISVNCNPLGMPPSIREAARAAIDDCEAYPDALCQNLRSALAKSQHLPQQWYVFGNGAASLLYQIFRALRPKRVLLPAPGFVEYERAAESVGATCFFFDSSFGRLETVSHTAGSYSLGSHFTDSDGGTRIFSTVEEGLAAGMDLVILCSPNNPTGQITDRCQLQRILAGLRGSRTVLLLDECFMDLVVQEEAERNSLLSWWQREIKIANEDEKGVLTVDCSRTEGVILLKAFTKTYAIPGLRLGYALIPDASLREAIGRQQPSWEVSIPSQAAGVAALAEEAYVREARRLIEQERQRLEAALTRLGMRVIPSQANYLLLYSPYPLYRPLLEEGILIRDCSDYRGLGEGWYRLCVSLPEKNEIVLRAIKAVAERNGGSVPVEERNG